MSVLLTIVLFGTFQADSGLACRRNVQSLLFFGSGSDTENDL